MSRVEISKKVWQNRGFDSDMYFLEMKILFIYILSFQQEHFLRNQGTVTYLTFPQCITFQSANYIHDFLLLLRDKPLYCTDWETVFFSNITTIVSWFQFGMIFRTNNEGSNYLFSFCSTPNYSITLIVCTIWPHNNFIGEKQCLNKNFLIQ